MSQNVATGVFVPLVVVVVALACRLLAKRGRADAADFMLGLDAMLAALTSGVINLIDTWYGLYRITDKEDAPGPSPTPAAPVAPAPAPAPYPPGHTPPAVDESADIIANQAHHALDALLMGFAYLAAISFALLILLLIHQKWGEPARNESKKQRIIRLWMTLGVSNIFGFVSLFLILLVLRKPCW